MVATHDAGSAPPYSGNSDMIMLTFCAKLTHPGNKEMQKRFCQEILDSMTTAALARCNEAIDT